MTHKLGPALDTSIVPEMRRGVNYSPGHVVIQPNGKVIMLRDDNRWVPLEDRNDYGLWFFGSDYVEHRIEVKRVSADYAIAIKI